MLFEKSLWILRVFTANKYVFLQKYFDKFSKNLENHHTFPVTQLFVSFGRSKQ